jgi:hypothetical protein
MCENVNKAVHLKTLIAEIKIMYAQWQKARKNRMPAKPIVKASI